MADIQQLRDDAAKRDQRFLKAVRVESHQELENIYAGHGAATSEHFLATVITSCSECSDWRSCFHVKSHFQSTKDSKRLVHVYFWWKALLGPAYPVTDEMLREDVWKNLESTCDLGVKKENGHAKQPGGPVCINPHHFVAIDKMRMLAVLVDSAVTFFGHMDNVAAAFQPVLDAEMNVLKSVPDVDAKFATIVRELTEAARQMAAASALSSSSSSSGIASTSSSSSSSSSSSRSKKAKSLSSAMSSSSSSSSSSTASSSAPSACLAGRDRRGAVRARAMPTVRETPFAFTPSAPISSSSSSYGHSGFQNGASTLRFDMLDVAEDIFANPNAVTMMSFDSLAATLNAAPSAAAGSNPFNNQGSADLPLMMNPMDDLFADLLADMMPVDDLNDSFDALSTAATPTSSTATHHNKLASANDLALASATNLAASQQFDFDRYLATNGTSGSNNSKMAAPAFSYDQVHSPLYNFAANNGIGRTFAPASSTSNLDFGFDMSMTPTPNSAAAATSFTWPAYSFA